MKLVQVQLIMAQVQIEIAWLTHFCQILVEKVPLNDVRVHCAIYESAVYQNLGQILMTTRYPVKKLTHFKLI